MIRLRYSLIFVLLVFGSSCAVYIPQTADIPLIDHKNDLRIDAGYSLGYNSGTATVSYGISDKLAVQVYGTTDFNQRYFYHGALGYYKKLKNDYVLELYGGLGNGQGNTSNHDIGQRTEANYMEYFTQFNYGKTGGSKSPWDFGFGLKTGYLRSNVDVKYDRNWYPDGNVPNDYSYVSDNFFIEPAVFTRVGTDNQKFGIKVTGLFTPIANTSYFPLNVALTFNLRLGQNTRQNKD